MAPDEGEILLLQILYKTYIDRLPDSAKKSQSQHLEFKAAFDDLHVGQGLNT